ncbi:hypothetical protein [uncultured Solobacterium sp.]|uniref:hypothetical protein n=1 Tax=uncultured Solobacterium sp. TaxID=747375 RepID=UPI0028D281A1|nr:hypothetical protein [uncultured Solobacterium sp.]
MNDIVQKATAVYLRLIENDAELIRLRKSIESGKASYEAAQKYSERSGQLAKKAISQVSNGDLNITQELLNPILEANYQDVLNVASQAQNVIYETANVNLKPATVSYDNTYAKDISAKLENYDDVDEALDTAENLFISASQNYVDEIGRRSAKFMDESGINVLVSREYDDVGVHTTDKGGGDVCHWCLERCGTDVPYDEAYEMGMFERHPGCGCIITYTTKRGVVIQGKGDWETNRWINLREDNEREKRIRSNESYVQNYKPVVRGTEAVFNTLSRTEINAKKVDGYENVYISDKTMIKPKALHNINKATESAIKKLDIDGSKKPIILIVDSSEIRFSLANYDAVNNLISYTPVVGDKKKIVLFQEGHAAEKDPYSTPFHEMYHCKQAQEYEKKHSKITSGNYHNYIDNLCAECKKKLDTLGVTDENVGGISKYAEKMYFAGKYDEVEAEYNISMLLKG